MISENKAKINRKIIYIVILKSQISKLAYFHKLCYNQFVQKNDRSHLYLEIEANMITIEKTLNIAPEDILRIRGILPCSTEKACFFDIETTGLSPKVSSLYLIGAVTIVEENAQLIQFFADDYKSEEALLTAFSDMLDSCSHVIHYNGSTFDIPYLEKKYAEHHLPSPFIATESIDIYKKVRSFHGKKQGKSAPPSYFKTPNLKLTTAEKLLGFDRGEDVSGKDCIKLYSEYMQHKFAHNDSEADRLFAAMLSHNHDDLVGTVLCTQLLMYTCHLPGTLTFKTTENSYTLTDTLPNSLTYPFKLEYDIPLYETEGTYSAAAPEVSPSSNGTADSSTSPISAHIVCDNTDLTLTLPIISDTLYHFFPDYKNYFYLPDEDMAIHKSVGTYVDKSHREPATAKNCYTKKTGRFLPLPAKSSIDEVHVFSYKDTPSSFIDIETAPESDLTALLSLFLPSQI